ncbi:DUF4845 domain-containing protein [Acinetobacter stercoris]|uniref:DUF4845 domain-containing protein n=1 Tax=Acinetobacter stercoris TaxID=2126983 RepID=A0A2U3MUD8_9GAMM|nr:DUF4845 domain-containing protein [Acinetobacter stercoris]SPL69048.1 hypothetical protein KPC_0226 [Acinetobacter stercoris]
MWKFQQGASRLTLLLGMVAFILIVKFLLAIWPAYWDDRVINTKIQELLKEAPEDITPSTFMTQMSQGLEMNNIRDLKVNDIVKVSKEKGLKVTKNYEVRKYFLFNIDLVLTFEKSFDQRSVKSK